MYLNKQKRTNLKGSIAWLEQKINKGENPELDPEVTLNFLKSILED